jgi:CDP-glucose 4,6-dehydratase
VELDASYRGRRVLVTGDTGFKGSWLGLWLQQLGAEVIGFAQPAEDPSDNYVRCGLANAWPHIDGDVRDHDALVRAMAEHEPHVVFHLAAQARVLESYRAPRETFATNVMGTVNLLEAARHVTSVRAVVIVSSDKCYANREQVTGYVENDPLGGSDPYSASKGAVEIVTAAMRASFFREGAAVATVRSGNAIGAGDRAPDRIVPDCIRALEAGVPIVLRNPDAARPWQHVLDALHGYLVLGARLLAGDAAAATAWNFGPGAGALISVRELVERMLAVWGSGSYRIETGQGPAEARLLALDSSKARAELGWEPVLDFAETVAMTVDGYRAEAGPAAAVRAHRLAQLEAFAIRARERARDIVP